MTIDKEEFFSRKRKFSYAIESYPILCERDVERMPLSKEGLSPEKIKMEFREVDYMGRPRILGIYQSYDVRTEEERDFVNHLADISGRMLSDIAITGRLRTYREPAVLPIDFIEGINNELIMVGYDLNHPHYSQPPSLEQFKHYIGHSDIFGRLAIHKINALPNVHNKDTLALITLHERISTMHNREDNPDFDSVVKDIGIFLTNNKEELMNYGLTREEYARLVRTQIPV